MKSSRGISKVLIGNFHISVSLTHQCLINVLLAMRKYFGVLGPMCILLFGVNPDSPCDFRLLAQIFLLLLELQTWASNNLK